MITLILPTIAAAAANLVIGFVWYHPKLFGRVWMRNTNITPDMAENGRKLMHFYNIAAFLAGVVIAIVMHIFGTAFGIVGLQGAVMVGFLAWLGFVMPTLLGTVLWEQKPLRLYLVNAGYWLVSFVCIACIVLY